MSVQPISSNNFFSTKSEEKNLNCALNVKVDKFTKSIMGFLMLSAIPSAEAVGGPGSWLFPVCYAGCVAALAASTGGWGAFFAFTACKAACIAAAVAF